MRVSWCVKAWITLVLATLAQSRLCNKWMRTMWNQTSQTSELHCVKWNKKRKKENLWLNFQLSLKRSFNPELESSVEKSRLSFLLSHGNRVRGHLTVGGETQNMFCVSIQVTIHYWLDWLCKWSCCFFFFLSFLFSARAASRPGGMRSICDGSQGSYCGAKRTSRGEDGGYYSRSERRSHPVILKADD